MNVQILLCRQVTSILFLPPQEARDYIMVEVKTVQSIPKTLQVPNKNALVRVYLLIAKFEALSILVVKLERAVISLFLSLTP